MEFEDMVPVVEAVLFAGGEPVEASRLCEITGLVKVCSVHKVCAGDKKELAAFSGGA